MIEIAVPRRFPMEALPEKRYINKNGLTRFLSDTVVVGWIDRYKP